MLSEATIVCRKMLRLPLVRVAGLSSGRFGSTNFHTTTVNNNSQQLNQQDLVEVFIDDIPVQVPPGTTVLQVNLNIIVFNVLHQIFVLFVN